MDREEKDFILEKVMVEYGDELVRLAYSYVRDADTAKDMVQNTFVKCYRHLDGFRYDAQMKTWLYRITINECKDYLKSWSYRMVQVKSMIQTTAKMASPSVERTVMDQYDSAALKETVFSLPKMYREVVYLYYYESLKAGEIADVLELPVNTVKTRLRRAKQRLKLKVEEAGWNGR